MSAHFALNRRKESLQPFIRSGVRKIAGKDLGDNQRGKTPFSVTGAAGASDIMDGMVLVNFCGLRGE